jgi:hypothetical protein
MNKSEHHGGMAHRMFAFFAAFQRPVGIVEDMHREFSLRHPDTSVNMVREFAAGTGRFRREGNTLVGARIFFVRSILYYKKV